MKKFTSTPQKVYGTEDFASTLGMYSWEELSRLSHICLDEMRDRQKPRKEIKRYEFHFRFESGGWNSLMAIDKQDAYLQAQALYPGSKIVRNSFEILSPAEVRRLEMMTW